MGHGGDAVEEVLDEVVAVGGGFGGRDLGVRRNNFFFFFVGNTDMGEKKIFFDSIKKVFEKKLRFSTEIVSVAWSILDVHSS